MFHAIGIHMTYDEIDLRILRALQRDAACSLEDLGAKVGLSRNALWRRIKVLDQSMTIQKRIAILDAAKLGFGLQVFILVRTASHSADWSARFAAAMRAIPEIQGAYRMSGELDYMIRARVADIASYDRLYQRLTQKIELADVSASFVMEEIKDTLEVPI